MNSLMVIGPCLSSGSKNKDSMGTLNSSDKVSNCAKVYLWECLGDSMLPICPLLIHKRAATFAWL